MTARGKTLDEELRRDIAEFLRRTEGGFVNDPDDPGGATNWGVTIGTLSASMGRPATVAEVRALTIDRATDIAFDLYFRRPNIGALPRPLWMAVFDCGYNRGPGTAVKLLQKTLNDMGADLAVDGGIGALTANAAHQAHRRVGGQELLDAFCERWRESYYLIGDRRAASRKYVQRIDGGKAGWITRAEEHMSPARRLTDAQHRARVATWNGTSAQTASPKPKPRPAKPAPQDWWSRILAAIKGK
jgi:lysozyme family protein